MKNIFLILFLFCAFSPMGSAQITRQWVATFNGQGDYNDRYTCLLRDGAGNYYLGGSTVNPGTDRDFLIQKSAPNGTILWTVQLNGNGDAADEVMAMKLTPTGGVVVTGISKGDNTSEDFWTVSLNTNGDTLWTRRFDYVGEYDQPNALSIDPLGNILVTGLSDGNPGSGENDDYLTLKYNADGELLWSKRYNGLGNAIDRAVGVATNSSGQVFVTGRSDNGINDDYVTICYDASGTQQWIKYDDRGGRDRATALTLDPTGNVLITGQSSNGDNEDFWTLKYTPNGTALWQKAYDFVDDDRAIAIATDPAGNVFITGQSDQAFGPTRNWDMATVAFSTNGSPLWSARYSGPLLQDEIPTAITADASGHVFVTGQGDTDPTIGIDYEIATICYQATTGNQLWVSAYGGIPNRDNGSNALVTDGAGGCVVAGFAEDNTAFRNGLALQYSSGGAQLWENQFNGIGDNNDAIRHLTVDNMGNVTASGFTVSNGDNRNFMLAHFDFNGNYNCRYVENGSAASAFDDAQGLILGGDGNPIAMGYVKNSGQSNDIFLSKFNASCDTIWARNINGSANGSERSYSMTSDGIGNLFLTGRSDQLPGPLANDMCYTLKVNENTGAVIWVKKYDADTTGMERGVVIKVKDPNQIYVAGRAFNGSNFDVFLLKYDAQGTLLWNQQWSSALATNDEPIDLVVAASGDIYVLYNTASVVNDSLHDLVLTKFNASGTTLWSALYNNPTGEDDQAVGMVNDGNGNIVIAGKSDLQAGSNITYGITLLKYSPNGSLLWSKSTASSSIQDQIADAITTNNSGQIYLAGHINAGTDLVPNYNIVTYVFDNNGEVLWHDTYDGAAFNGSDIPNTILVKNNDFYIGGSTVITNQQRDMLVIKYSGAVTETTTPVQNTISVYPNPVSGRLFVSGLEPGSVATIEITDSAGKVVLEETMEEKASCDVSKLPAGIYFYRLLLQNQSLLSGKIIH